MKKVILLFVIMMFFLSCAEKENNKKSVDIEKKRDEKPEAGFKPDKPVLLEYSFDKITDGKVFNLSGNIEIKTKIIPDPKEEKQYIELHSNISFNGKLVKTGFNKENNYLFDFKINELKINSPGSGVAFDYNSKIDQKFLNPQIKKFDQFVGIDIPLKISKSGNIVVDIEKFFLKHEALREKLNNEDLEKIKTIVSYYFLNYPERSIQVDETFTSNSPFNGEYLIDSLTEDNKYTLIIPKKIKMSEKVISSSLKGWMFIDNSTGLLKKSLLKHTEKKNISHNDIKLLININMKINLKIL